MDPIFKEMKTEIFIWQKRGLEYKNVLPVGL
jgi:hypothetical protein